MGGKANKINIVIIPVFFYCYYCYCYNIIIDIAIPNVLKHVYNCCHRSILDLDDGELVG